MQGQAATEQQQQPPRRHTVIVDGRVVYDGDNWDTAVRVFCEVGQRQDVLYVEHKIDGRQAALWGCKR